VLALSGFSLIAMAAFLPGLPPFFSTAGVSWIGPCLRVCWWSSFAALLCPGKPAKVDRP